MEEIQGRLEGIRLNSMGREPEAVISPGDLYNELIDLQPSLTVVVPVYVPPNIHAATTNASAWVDTRIDTRYYAPDPKWFFGEFAAFWAWFQKTFGYTPQDYEEEKRDCDDYRRAWRFAVDQCHGKNKLRKVAHSAFDAEVVLYKRLNGVSPRGDGGHGTGIVRLSDGQWHFNEPITNEHCLAKDAVLAGVARINRVWL